MDLHSSAAGADERLDLSPRRQRGKRTLLLPKPSSAPATSLLFKVQRLLRTDKEGKNADTICLGEAIRKQSCYSTAFYLDADA